MKIIKSFRKTLSMSIDKDWVLIIKAPLFVTKKIIDGFIEKNKVWIEKRKKFILENVRNFEEWEKFYFFWKEYELKFSKDYKKLYFDWNFFYLNPENKEKAQEFFSTFYKIESKKYIKNKLDEISKQFDLEYNSLKITSAKWKWGSCTNKKNINFSYRLIMAPIETINYVIVHELAHIKQMNHSKKFWQEVEKMMTQIHPWNYKIHKKWLKENSNNFIL